MRVLQIGNLEPRHSTETHLGRALRNNGHEVVQAQENNPDTWRDFAGLLDCVPDFVLWTRTPWDWPNYGLGRREARTLQWAALDLCKSRGIPTTGLHLDRFWGLTANGREAQIHHEPFFRVDLLCTADGGHDAEWRKAGVEHAWFPPAVSRDECVPGNYREEYASDVVFVGSWQGGYHREWPHRAELVDFLRETYGERVRFWPRVGEPAVRNEDLRDLYASVKVAVGDSCLVPNADGSPCARYWSDRVPETLGRGAYLIHPKVEGLWESYTDADGSCYGPQVWPLGDWDALREAIDRALRLWQEFSSFTCDEVRPYVMREHTYERRMEQLVALLTERGMVRTTEGIPT